MADYLPVTDLVTRAKNGDQQAWDALVERYAPLVWSICRRYRLERADAEDVCQAVWFTLVARLDHLRDPAALPGWLATTTRRECGRVLHATGRRRAGEQVAELLLRDPDLNPCFSYDHVVTKCLRTCAVDASSTTARH